MGKEIWAKSILFKSKVFEYTINPFVGCEYGCSYCYARFMKQFTGHLEPWGEFVDIKINAADLLKKEIDHRKKGRVWISGVCDPYQPLEKKDRITRQCLDVLLKHDWSVIIQTKSPLVLRDLGLFQNFSEVDVGFTLPTASEDIRGMFEPKTPPHQTAN